MRLLPPALCLTLSLCACAQFPALDGTIDPPLANADYPELVPLGPLLAQASGSGSDGTQIQQALAPRLANLRNRAQGLRGPVLTPAMRARLLGGVS